MCNGINSPSAGVGRTGTFICIDNVLEQIKKEKVVDIAGVINRMRHQRMSMVQTAVSIILGTHLRLRSAVQSRQIALT